MKKRYWPGALLGAALLFMLLCPAKVNAANLIYVCKGVTASINFKSAPVPNAAWTVGKSSILKLKSSTPLKAVYTGKKVGRTTLTVYNRRVPSQKYTWTVYVMPSKKLNKMDFQLYGNTVTDTLGMAEGSNFVDDAANSSTAFTRIVISNKMDKSDPGSYFQTTRTAQIYDSYSRICTLYGKLSLKAYKLSTDRYYKYICAKKPGQKNAFKNYVSKNVKYYVDYGCGSAYRIRFMFNKSKQVTMILYFKNYGKLPV